MSTIREKINVHLPIVLKVLNTASLIVIALTAICGSQSLKKLSDSHQLRGSLRMQQGQIKMMRERHLMRHQKPNNSLKESNKGE